jgi:5-deoxy-glucuronate isomerase
VGVVLSGRLQMEADTLPARPIGERRNVFSGRAWSFYLSRSSTYHLRALEPASVALVSAPAKRQVPSYVIPPQEVRVVPVGAHNWYREVHNIVGPERAASRLLVGETFNQPGAWSGSPPHRHERRNYPEEVKLEELYYFKLSPPTGFGVQVVYTDDRRVDAAFLLRDDYAVALPRGYHPVVAAPGHQIYYLWMMAGEDRRMAPRDDPDHAWLKHCETVIRAMR